MQRAMYTVTQLIGGVWGAGGEAGELTVHDPADGRPVTSAPVPTADEVDKAVAAAAVAEAADDLAQATTAEMGKPLADARGGVEAGIATLRQYAELAPARGGRTLHGDPAAIDFMTPQPRGVVAAITPWNDPVAVSCGLLGAALVTGNVVLHKPSERTPATGWLLARAFDTALPAGVLSLLSGGPTTAAALIATAAAGTGAKVLLENGGSDPLIVDADVDPSWAAGEAALGAFANAGQICVAVERIYAHRDVAEDFVAALVERAAALRVGPGRDPRTQLGPLVDRRHRDQVHGQVIAAVADGARLRVGGTLPEGPGAFYPATVIDRCRHDLALIREETFGPVAPVVVVDSFSEALRCAADSPYGLAATVLTGSMSHAQRAWRELPVGTVKVNSVFGGAPARAPTAPGQWSGLRLRAGTARRVHRHQGGAHPAPGGGHW